MWIDASSQGNHAVIIQGTITKTLNSINGNDVLSGTVSSGISFPTAILPPVYTIFHITKYNGTNKKRIWDGIGIQSGGWLSGFWNNASGVAYHQGWLTTAFGTSLHGSNWVLSTDTNTMYRSNKVNRTNGTPGATSYARLGLNMGSHITTEGGSDWAVACAIVYNRNLSLSEIQTVENTLATIYGL